MRRLGSPSTGGPFVHSGLLLSSPYLLLVPFTGINWCHLPTILHTKLLTGTNAEKMSHLSELNGTGLGGLSSGFYNSGVPDDSPSGSSRCTPDRPSSPPQTNETPHSDSSHGPLPEQTSIQPPQPGSDSPQSEPVGHPPGYPKLARAPALGTKATTTGSQVQKPSKIDKVIGKITKGFRSSKGTASSLGSKLSEEYEWGGSSGGGFSGGGSSGGGDE